MTIEPAKSRLDNVQALRALAAILVVVLHISGLGTKALHDVSFMSGVDPWGNAGVDLFFVISGFIMLHIHQARARSGVSFLANRAVRIVPLYWLVTILFVVAIAAGIMAPVDDAGPGQPWTSLLFVSQPLSGAHPLVYVGWTLEYEAFFYLCFAAAIELSRRLGIDILVPLFALVLGSILLLGVDIVAIEFLYGAILARLLVRKKFGSGAGLILMIGGILLLALSFGDGTAMEQRALLFGIPATMMVAGAVILPQKVGSLLVDLGDASYSLYLTHLFTLALVLAAMRPGVGWATVMTAIVFVQLFAIAVHRWIERPLGEAARKAMLQLGGPRPLPA